MGCFGRTSCTVHSISAQTSEEEIKCTKAKKFKENRNVYTVHKGANVAWEGLTSWGYVAYSEYWKKKIPAPVKCQKNCTCGPNKFVATFDWNSYPYTLTYQEIKGNESIKESIRIT